MSGDSTLHALAVRAVGRVLFGRLPSPESSYGRSVVWGEAGSSIARETLAAGRPCLIARFGSTELSCVNYSTRWRMGVRLPLSYPRIVRRNIQINSGVFPTDDAALDRFCGIYLNAASDVDVLGVWFNRSEHKIIEAYCPGARLVDLEALNCVHHDHPWSAELAGKTVLVVHPFAKSIESQYNTKRTLLFSNPRVLPEFELKTIPAVQSIAGNDCGYATWFDALSHMSERIADTDFDVAIIGAGAYGLPLAASVKAMGRQAVQLGGATQLLFGIRGRRWEVESPDDIAPLFNEHWVRPSDEETPQNRELVEGGCYW